MKTAKRLFLHLRVILPAASVFIVAAAVIILFYFDLSPAEKVVLFSAAHRNLAVLILGMLLILGILIALARYFVANYFVPIHEISEEMQLIATGNVQHRLKGRGAPAIIKLIETLNQSAEAFHQLQTSVAEKIVRGNKQYEREKTILASLISQLESGVIVCNLEGLVLLYNKQARTFMADNPGGELGLGRSILGIFDKNIISHTILTIKAKVEKKSRNTSSVFIFVVGNTRTLRIRAVPVFASGRELQGYILLIRDISEQVSAHSRQIQLIINLSEGLRGLAANIRSAIETITQFPNMKTSKRMELQSHLLKDAMQLSDKIEKNTGNELLKLKSQWTLDDIQLADIMQLVQRMAFEKLGISIEFSTVPPGVWIAADLYSLATAIVFLLAKLKNLKEFRQVHLDFAGKDGFVKVELNWPEIDVDSKSLEAWNSEMLLLDGNGLNRTLDEVISEHNAAFWLQRNGKQTEKGLHILLPVIDEPKFTPGLGPVDIHNAPSPFYDFDLFNQAGQSVETDDRPLTALTYTVFDTETTGLDPSGGDELISIGAVRIVNGRLLVNEVFDQLIDPQRKVTEASIQVHGITQEMLAGQPVAAEVLPRFLKFAKDTILVAHNAAFDMKFLQMQEEKSKICFDNPILDTLLLSSIVHSNQQQHNLDALCHRFGIENIGRHSALGDAMATAEIFLKLIPFLEKNGIRTLKQAREASEKNYYSALKY